MVYLNGPSSERFDRPNGDLESTVAEMRDMVNRYSSNFQHHKPSQAAPVRDVILLTGATGALGSTLLAFLVQLADVARIYVINRRSPTGAPLLQRQIAALVDAGFDADIVRSPKITLLESDLPEIHMGLADEVYEEIRTSVTHIFHNAYRVNFLAPLSGFEPNMKTLRHLIDLSISSPHPIPPRLLFVSSSGIWIGNSRPEGPMKEVITLDPAQATATGYLASKWVCEHILANAERGTPLRPIIIRAGQFSGGANGVWNSKEWFPRMIRSSTYLGCLPAMEDMIAYIPADVTAKAMVEMRNSPFAVHHLEHPRPVPWNTIMEAISKTLRIPLVPHMEWFGRLERSGSHVKNLADVEAMQHKNPAWVLRDFLKELGPYGRLSGFGIRWRTAGQNVLDMSNSLSIAPSLDAKNLPPLCGEDVIKWLHYWRSIGFLDWPVHSNL